MGYESRVYAMIKTDVNGFSFTQKLAVFDLACMDYEFRKFFTKEVDFTFYSDFQGTEEETDCYGEKLKYTDNFDGMIYFLEQNEMHDPYRRQKLFVDFLKSLKGFSLDDNEKIILVHYGY